MQSPEGWYESGIASKRNCSTLSNNHEGSLHRLNTLVKKLRRTEMLDDYNAVI